MSASGHFLLYFIGVTMENNMMRSTSPTGGMVVYDRVAAAVKRAAEAKAAKEAGIQSVGSVDRQKDLDRIILGMNSEDVYAYSLEGEVSLASKPKLGVVYDASIKLNITGRMVTFHYSSLISGEALRSDDAIERITKFGMGAGVSISSSGRCDLFENHLPMLLYILHRGEGDKVNLLKVVKHLGSYTGASRQVGPAVQSDTSRVDCSTLGLKPMPTDGKSIWALTDGTSFLNCEAYADQMAELLGLDPKECNMAGFRAVLDGNNIKGAVSLNMLIFTLRLHRC